MTCEEIRNELVAYHDGELSERDRRYIALHLESCQECAREDASNALLDQLLTQVDRISPSTDFTANFWRRLEQEKQISHEHYLTRWWREFRSSFSRWQMVPALAGAASIIVFFGYILSEYPLLQQFSVTPLQGSPATRAKVGPEIEPVPTAETASAPTDIPVGLKDKAEFFANYRLLLNLDRYARFDEIAAVQIPTAQEYAMREQDIPPVLREKSEFFAQYPILEQMDQLENFDAVLAPSVKEGQPQRG